ncbi:MAG TPA: hypothetical protein VLF71_05725 [Candidatus Saccharimonadales bacterium]|nr:hypothetical protein [Candidatus Saccharimonadales bacterium]
MAPEALCPFPRPTPDVAALLALPPDAQIQRVVGVALGVSNHPEIRGEAAAVAAPASPLAVEGYQQAAGTRFNIQALSTLARLASQEGPLAGASWRAAQASAQNMGRIGFGAYQPFALESLANMQTDPTRLGELHAIALTCPLDERLGILAAVGIQQARGGDIKGAQATRAAAKSPFLTDAHDEIGLALIDAHFAAHPEDSIDSYMVLASISKKMKAWGILKMNNHGHHPDTSILGQCTIETMWPCFNVRQQREIIRDVLSGGDTARALQLARCMAPEGSSSRKRRAQEDTVVGIANWQADTGDVEGGLATLEEERAAAEVAFNEAVEEGARLAAGQDQFGHNIRRRRNSHAQYEQTERYNRMIAHSMALDVRRHPQEVLRQLNQAIFYGDDAGRTGQNSARRIVAPAFARQGLIAEAVSVAAAMQEMDGDPMYLREKALAYLGIASAIRERRLAAAPTPATMVG